LGVFVAGMQRPSRPDWRLVLVLLAALGSVAATINIAGGASDRAWVMSTVGLVGLCFHAGQVYAQQHPLNRQLRAVSVVLVSAAVLAFAKPNLFRLALAGDDRPQVFAQLASIDNKLPWIPPCEARLRELVSANKDE
jgi:hypothetical protein